MLDKFFVRYLGDMYQAVLMDAYVYEYAKSMTFLTVPLIPFLPSDPSFPEHPSLGWALASHHGDPGLVFQFLYDILQGNLADPQFFGKGFVILDGKR